MTAETIPVIPFPRIQEGEIFPRIQGGIDILPRLPPIQEVVKVFLAPIQEFAKGFMPKE